jgi:Chemotaxis protein histidine kinase and related kinases
VSRAGNVERVNNEEVVRHDGDIYPVIHLREVLQDNTRSSPAPAAADGGYQEETDADTTTGDVFQHDGDDGMLVRIREETRPVALHCDEVLHQEEVVVKPLEGILSGIPGLSGTAVLGDGDVVTILDVETLGETY